MDRRSLASAALSGAMLVCAFPPFRTGFLALTALVPLLLLFEHGRIRTAFTAGYAAGLVWSACTLYWVTLPTVAGGIALVLFLPAVTGSVCALYRLLRIRLGVPARWLMPALWVASEWVFSLGQLAFPWNMLAYTQGDYLPVVQVAAVTGASGVSLWVLVVNVAVLHVVEYFRRCRRRYAAAMAVATGLFVLAPVAYGVSVLASAGPAGGTVRAALLQGNIDPYAKWDPAFVNASFDSYMDMTRDAARSGPALVVWPETAAPTYLAGRRGRAYRERLHALVDSLGIPVFTGAPHYRYDRPQKRMRYYNSAFLFRPGSRRLDGYDKIRLVPFSEKIPFEEEIPVLRKVNLGEADFSYGTDPAVFDAAGFSFGTVICFESAFGSLIRRMVRGGAGFIVNITNDGWFGRTSGPYQHFRMAVFRAVENRVGIARCANSGVSAFIGPYGRVRQATGLFSRAVIVGEVSAGPVAETPFTRYGDVVSPVCAGIALCAVAAAAATGLRPGRAA